MSSPPCVVPVTRLRHWGCCPWGFTHTHGRSWRRIGGGVCGDDAVRYRPEQAPCGVANQRRHHTCSPVSHTRSQSVSSPFREHTSVVDVAAVAVGYSVVQQPSHVDTVKRRTTRRRQNADRSRQGVGDSVLLPYVPSTHPGRR